MFRKHTNTILAFALGLMLGLAALGGYMLGQTRPQTAQATPAVNSLEELHLKAMSGYGSETFGMITGPIDPESEGVFTLDYLTGTLRCYVINPRTGRFGARFTRNIVADLNVEKGKKPSFVMATGFVQFRGFSGPSRPANCVLYVADANTGRFGCYVIPWTQGAFAAAVDQLGELKLLVAGDARPVEVRD